MWMRSRVMMLALICACGAGRVAADALVVSKAMDASTILEAYLDEESLKIEAEVALGSIPVFADLLPDELHGKLGLPVVRRGTRHGIPVGS